MPLPPPFDPECRIAIEPEAALALSSLPEPARVSLCERLRMLSLVARTVTPMELLGLQVEASGWPRLRFELAGHQVEYQIDPCLHALTVLAIAPGHGESARAAHLRES